MEIFQLWQLWCIAGVVFFIIEIFTPVLFFFNVGLACFVAAGCAGLQWSMLVQVLVFGISSVVFVIWLRPCLIKRRKCAEVEALDMYVGRNARVIKTITPTDGRIYIYDEEWSAASINGEDIPEGYPVKIVKTEDLVMYVERIETKDND